MEPIKVDDDSKNKKSFFSRRSPWLILVILAILVTGYGYIQYNESNGEGSQITVYTTIPEFLYPNYLQKFEEEYPEIEVYLEPGSTIKITEKIFEEANDPQADVIWGLAITSILEAEWRGMLEPYSPENISNTDAPHRDPANPPNWVGLEAWTLAFCVNQEWLDELGLPTPESWQDLMNEEYEGHIIIPNPKESAVGFLILATILQHDGEVNGWLELDKLKQNIAQQTSNFDLLCSGENYPIGISNADHAVDQKEELGKPIEVIYPADGLGWQLEASALIKKQQIKPAAQTFLNWAISQDARQMYSSESVLSLQNLNHDSEGPILIEMDFPWVTANEDHIISQWCQDNFCVDD